MCTKNELNTFINFLRINLQESYQKLPATPEHPLNHPTLTIRNLLVTQFATHSPVRNRSKTQNATNLIPQCAELSRHAVVPN